MLGQNLRHQYGNLFLKRSFSFKHVHKNMEAREKFLKEASRFNEKFERKCKPKPNF